MRYAAIFVILIGLTIVLFIALTLHPFFDHTSPLPGPIEFYRTEAPVNFQREVAQRSHSRIAEDLRSDVNETFVLCDDECKQFQRLLASWPSQKPKVLNIILHCILQLHNYVFYFYFC